MTSNENWAKRPVKLTKRAPALVQVPEKLEPLIRLANLLPKTLRSSEYSPNAKSATPRRPTSWSFVVIDGECRYDDEAISSMFNLKRVLAELPLELQAFVLHDEYGRFVEGGDDLAQVPLSDPYHFQSCNNFALLEQPERKLHSIIARAEKRIDIESKRADDRVRLRNKPQKDFDPYEIGEPWSEYQVGDRKFAEVGFRKLTNRARERFFFILASEEILSALVGPNTQEKLNRARYVERSGSTRSYLYIENDEVRVYPSPLFSFVQGIEVSRVRRCEICKDYFWAGRKDRKVCSPRCGAAKRKREERKRNLERKLGIRRGRRRKEK